MRWRGGGEHLLPLEVFTTRGKPFHRTPPAPARSRCHRNSLLSHVFRVTVSEASIRTRSAHASVVAGSTPARESPAEPQRASGP